MKQESFLGPRTYSQTVDKGKTSGDPAMKRPCNNDGGDSDESDADLFKDEEESPVDQLKD